MNTIYRHIGTARIGVIQQDLLPAQVSAIMLSANNHLRASPTRWSWSQEVERRAGQAYVDECTWVSQSAGPDGLVPGSAVVMGAGALAPGSRLRFVIQAVTIRYDRSGSRQPATPQIVYRAVRSALEKAEIFHVDTIATYLMAIRPGYGAVSDDLLADALCRALVDHAAIAHSIQEILICEADPGRFALAEQALSKAAARRS